MSLISFEQKILEVCGEYSRKTNLEVIQVNVGDRCNQRCVHCHINASPRGKKVMSKSVMDAVIQFVTKNKELSLELTGGCVELNPFSTYLIEKTAPHVRQLTVRTNLTILLEKPEMIDVYKKNRVRMVASMPCYTKQNVDAQRGTGAYDKSITVLKKLNQAGYGKKPDLILDLVYNPGGAALPGPQNALEQDYKRELSVHGIVFNRLLTITNAPINRFETFLKKRGEYETYVKLLTESFNSEVAGRIMCRTLLSVGWDGLLYDCDFNLALGMPIRDTNGNARTVSSVNADSLRNSEIIFADHCYCCTAGAGSSCSGALAVPAVKS